MTERIYNYLNNNQYSEPRLVVDLELISKRYFEFKSLLPDTDVFYAVKANPAPEVLKLLAELGSCFDTASWVEIQMCLTAGARPDQISYGNTIKKEDDIKKAYDAGIRLFSYDSLAELHKIARVAPEAKVICRILCDCVGADWPLSRKFGTTPDDAEFLLEEAHKLGLEACGLSFHVGSQQSNTDAWNTALKATSRIFKNLSDKGINLTIVNMGGGFPAKYVGDIPKMEDYANSITMALREHFANHLPKTIIEPGRGLVGDAGILQSEIVLISEKPLDNSDEKQRWVYLDIGKFGGLAETIDESIRYNIRTHHDNDNKVACIIAGPTCDSVDILYEKKPYMLPISINIGEYVYIEGTGAYTSTYATNHFNGFAPLKTICI